ncbi:hypothetical protein E2562_032997 [Oryza meyeriana var. granulata]|uniref:BHLH domain-containing protein n=1 Tax=Oryza meyeriana var. granulata TaxID=110450 RepID=A0A6G1CVU9_9ORYZ|nr:hypothetical protein E2562_032997 [Oryza meyeriana var. granulata]
MASPPPPQPPSPSAAGAPAPVDALFLQNLMSRVQLRPPFLDTNSFLTQDLDEFLLNEFAALSAAAGGASDDDDEDEDGEGSDGEVVSGEARRRRTLAREEAKLEKEIVRLVLAGEADEALKPNSGQSVAVGDHHVCIGFHDETGGEYRVWEWHGHVMIFDDEDGYSAEYIYGNHFEPLAAATARAKKKEKEKREKELSSGLRDLIVGDGGGANGSKENGKGGAPRVVRRNVVNAPAAPARLATDYDLFHHISFSPSLQNLQSPTLFTTRSSESYLGESSIYGGGARPAFAQFSYTQPTAAPSASHLVRWTSAGEPMTGDAGDGGFRSSKRIKTSTTATTQGPRHGLKCHAKPRNQPAKPTCKRSQKLGDKITALQQLVSPYGKTDTASVLHEAAACIRQLHHQIQILTAPYPGPSCSPASSQQDAGGGDTTTELRRRGLCVAALSPAAVSLVAEGTAAHGHRRTDVEDQRRIWFSNHQ